MQISPTTKIVVFYRFFVSKSKILRRSKALQALVSTKANGGESEGGRARGRAPHRMSQVVQAPPTEVPFPGRRWVLRPTANGGRHNLLSLVFSTLSALRSSHTFPLSRSPALLLFTTSEAEVLLALQAEDSTKASRRAEERSFRK